MAGRVDVDGLQEAFRRLPYFAKSRVLISNGTTSRVEWNTLASLAAGLDHNSLLNLTAGDVHTHYALLAGRSGGQTLIGGTASGNNLTLQSTSHATRGKVYFNILGTSYMDEAGAFFLFGDDLRFGSSNLAYMSGQNRFRHKQTMALAKTAGSQTINSTTVTALNFGGEDIDTDALHDNATNNSRITIALAGKYLVGGTVSWDAQTLGTVTILQSRIHKNGTIYGPPANQSPLAAATFATYGQGVPVGPYLMSLAATDYLELACLHDKTAAGTLTVGNTFISVLWAVYVGE